MSCSQLISTINDPAPSEMTVPHSINILGPSQGMYRLHSQGPVGSRRMASSGKCKIRFVRENFLAVSCGDWEVETWAVCSGTGCCTIGLCCRSLRSLISRMDLAELDGEHARWVELAQGRVQQEALL